VPPETHLRRQVIAQRQVELLRPLLRSLIPENAFYTAKFEAADIPAKVSHLGDFYERFPFTTKDELMANQRAFPPYGNNLAFPLERYTRCHQSSGTSSTPLRWLDTTESWDWMLQNWSVIFRASNITGADVAFFAFSFGPFIGFWLAFEAAQRAGIRCIAGGGMSSLARLRNIYDHGATVLFCTPTYALHLIEVAAANGFDLKSSPVKTILVAGEPGGSIPSTRQRILEAWTGARVIDHHGMTEVGPVSFECPARPHVLHVIETAYIPEIIDPVSGAHRSSGETGELVLTTLGRSGSPLIRYRTGDLVKSSVDNICVCGRSDLALEGGILGRTDEMIIIRGVNVYPGAIEEILRQNGAVNEYQVRLPASPELQQIVIDIEPAPGRGGPELVASVEAALQASLNLRIPIRLVPPGSLPRFEMKAARWVRA
jgi:phenylacetate-CoA ligase